MRSGAVVDAAAGPHPAPTACRSHRPRPSRWSICRRGVRREGGARGQRTQRDARTTRVGRQVEVARHDRRLPGEPCTSRAAAGFHPARKLRWVDTTVSRRPRRPAGDCRDPRLVADDLHPGAGEDHRHGHPQGRQPHGPLGHHRQAAEQRDAVRRTAAGPVGRSPPGPGLAHERRDEARRGVRAGPRPPPPSGRPSRTAAGRGRPPGARGRPRRACGRPRRTGPGRRVRRSAPGRAAR
jgi:hypothetical protein